MLNEDNLKFIKEIDLLKTIERMTLLHNGGRRENSAEHSWHLAVSVMVLKEYATETLNIERAIQLALIHDIVEIDAGDTFVYGDMTHKMDKEILAIHRLTDLLPNNSKEFIKALWFEYENATSYEARFVAALDRFLPMYSNYLNSGHSWKKNKIKVSQVLEKNKKTILNGIPALWPIAEKIIEKAIEEKYLET